MAVPSLPAQGSPSWFAWAQGLHDEVTTDRLSDTALRAAFVASGLPSHTGTTAHAYDPARSLYNLKASNTRKIRAQLGAAKAGTGLCRVLCAGDSLTAGQGSSPGTGDYPTRLRQYLAAAGYTTGELIYAFNNAGGNSRWSIGAGWTQGGLAVPFVYTSTTNTATYTSSVAGTVVDVLTFGNTTPFTISIDGGSAQTVTGNGQQAGQIISFTGLANTTHTVVVTSASSGVTYLAAVGVRSASGVQIANAGLGAVTSTGWLATGTDQWFGPLGTSRGVAANVVLLELGMNDALLATGTSALQTSLTAIVQDYQTRGADVLLAASGAPSTTGNPGGYAAISDATFNTYLAALYAVADTCDVPLLDLTDALGRYPAADAVGLMGDGVHLSATGHAAKALTWQRAIGA